MKFRNLSGRDYVALILAVALLLAVVFTSVSLLYAVIVNERRNLSDAATNLMTMLFGGVIAILGGYIGAVVDNKKKDDKEDEK
jgi:hypothetical protein